MFQCQRYIQGRSQKTTSSRITNLCCCIAMGYTLMVSSSCKTNIETNEYRAWYKNGVPHREDGPAVIYSNGDEIWFKKGVLHRINGPALDFASGDKYWFKEGLYHRENGPAIIYENGTKRWYLNGKNFTEKEFNEAMK